MVEITIKGSAKEIAALAVEVQERQIESSRNQEARNSSREVTALLRAARLLEKHDAEHTAEQDLHAQASEEQNRTA